MAAIPTTLQARLTAVRERIAAACAAAGRAADSVRLVAVSKTFSAETLREAVAAGQYDFGENYLQEAIAKMNALAAMYPQARQGRTLPLAARPALQAGALLQALAWHFIGPIQSNKTRAIAERFDWVHTVAREKIARRLSEQRPRSRGPLQVCLEVNLSGESSKSGISPGDVSALAHTVAGLPNLRLRGLMAIPEPTEDLGLQHRPFAALRELKESLQRDGLTLDTLSMGMSADLEAAIAEGATIVRVGSALFGERKKASQ